MSNSTITSLFSNDCFFLSDVKKLVSTDLLTDSLISGIARVANLKNSKVVVAPSGAKVWFICMSFSLFSEITSSVRWW